MKKALVDLFVKEKETWIAKTRNKLQARENEPALPPFTEEEKAEMKGLARELILPKVEQYSRALGVEAGKVTVRCQRTLWGSCTKDGNLSFNCLLCLCPPEVLDYVVIHELCHRIYMDHSKAFWEKVGELCPDYKICRRWLKEKGRSLIKRAR